MFNNAAMRRLHRLLAYRPGTERLDIAVTVSGLETAVVAGNAEPVILTERAAAVDLRRMLQHYPVPVVINGQSVDTAPWTDEAAVTATRYDGDIASPYLVKCALIAGPGPGNTILLEGVLYDLAPCPDLKPDHRYHRFTTYVVPDRQDGQPHWARYRECHIRPNYRRDRAAGLADYAFSVEDRNARCAPPLEVYAELQQQRQIQEVKATGVIREATGATELGDPVLASGMPETPSHRDLMTPFPKAAHLIPYGQPVAIGGATGFQGEPAAGRSIAYGLYRNPEPGLVPVAPHWCQAGPPIPPVTCDRVTVVDAAGNATDYRFNAVNEVYEASGGNGRRSHVVNAQAVTAHLTVKPDDEPDRNIALPLDIFCDGAANEETVFLTAAWQPEHALELRSQLFNIYCDPYELPPDLTEQGYRDELEILTCRLLAGDQEALRLQLQKVCDNFYPGMDTDGFPPITVTGHGQSLAWQPIPVT